MTLIYGEPSVLITWVTKKAKWRKLCKCGIHGGSGWLPNAKVVAYREKLPLPHSLGVIYIICHSDWLNIELTGEGEGHVGGREGRVISNKIDELSTAVFVSVEGRDGQRGPGGLEGQGFKDVFLHLITIPTTLIVPKLAWWLTTPRGLFVMGMLFFGCDHLEQIRVRRVPITESDCNA